MKVLIVLLLAAVLVVLASAGVFMIRRGADSGEAGDAGDAGDKAVRDKRMAWALALRVGLSIALFVFILVSWRLGWVRPGGLPIGS